MKVLLINKFFFNKGGADRVFFDTKRILEERGHDTMDFAMNHPRNEFSLYQKYFVDEVDFTTVVGALRAYGNIYSHDAASRLDLLLREERPDIAHCHNAYFQISPSIFRVLKKHKIPVVYTVHDYHLICPNYKLFTQNKVCQRCKGHNYLNAIRYKCQDNNFIKSCGIAGVMFFNRFFRFYERGVNYFITPSQFMKDMLVSWNFVGADRIFVVPNSVDLNKFSLNSDIASRKYFLYSGRLSQEKGIPIVIEAFKKIKKSQLKILGEGPLYTELKKKTSRMKNIELLGYESDSKKIAEIIGSARAVIVPSLWYENYPLSVLEAFACGTPVIGSAIGGIPEQVLDNKTGYTFPVGNVDALREKILLMSDDVLLQRFSVGARGFVEKESDESVYYKRIMSIYKKAIKNITEL